MYVEGNKEADPIEMTRKMTHGAAGLLLVVRKEKKAASDSSFVYSVIISHPTPWPLAFPPRHGVISVPNFPLNDDVMRVKLRHLRK